MGPLVGQLLLQSLLAPFVLAGLIMMTARWFGPHGLGQDGGAIIAPALAIAAGVIATYLLAFGWPPILAVSARAKIVLSAIIGLVLGLLVEGRSRRTRYERWARFGLITGAIGIPLWIGLPALQQGRPESAFLILPSAAALVAPALFFRGAPSGGTLGLLILLTMTAGLAVIAAFAKALSFAVLALSLGGALLAILMLGREPLALPVVVMSAAMLLALTTALLLYSDASLPALLVLGTVLGAGRLAGASDMSPEAKAPVPRVLVCCLLPAAAAMLIARIDAGPISIY
ncbi:MAG: hypothetical protein OEU92_22615 [Alphaproteobacteria bacterium]|nr:hypothetical protein [Alphaproteobacteria bacterium]